ncbi:MAG: hypothetical protein ABIJ21_01795 [Nanoarchaeota archaeon]
MTRTIEELSTLEKLALRDIRKDMGSRESKGGSPRESLEQMRILGLSDSAIASVYVEEVFAYFGSSIEFFVEKYSCGHKDIGVMIDGGFFGGYYQETGGILEKLKQYGPEVYREVLVQLKPKVTKELLEALKGKLIGSYSRIDNAGRGWRDVGIPDELRKVQEALKSKKSWKRFSRKDRRNILQGKSSEMMKEVDEAYIAEACKSGVHYRGAAECLFDLYKRFPGAFERMGSAEEIIEDAIAPSIEYEKDLLRQVKEGYRQLQETYRKPSLNERIWQIFQ